MFFAFGRGALGLGSRPGCLGLRHTCTTCAARDISHWEGELVGLSGFEGRQEGCAIESRMQLFLAFAYMELMGEGRGHMEGARGTAFREWNL